MKQKQSVERRPGTPAPIARKAFDDYEFHLELDASSQENYPWELPLNDEPPGTPFSLDVLGQSSYAAGRIATSQAVEYEDDLLDLSCFDLQTTIPTDQDFLQLIDGAYRPPISCSYCRYNQLECLIIRTTMANPNPVSACSSCVALFRECSLAVGEKRKPSEFETSRPIMGHLHGVNEEGQDGIEQYILKNDAGSPAGNILPLSPGLILKDDISRPKWKRSISKQDVRVLKGWLSEHWTSPYPTQDEKLQLRASTGLTLPQISNWFANARRRQRQAQSSPITSIPIPATNSGQKAKTREITDMTPMMRWQNSPPKDEPIHPFVIAQAIASRPNQADANSHLNEMGEESYTSFDNSSISNYSQSGVSSGSSNSAWSHGSWISQRSYMFIPRSRRPRRQKRYNFTKSSSNSPAIYHCTFCPDSFKKKHDWQRHEKSIHLPLEHWICCSGDGTIPGLDSTSKKCIFCGISSPSQAHLNTHEYNTCSERSILERTFRRKDHLRQHLTKFHQCSKPFGDVFELWKINWRRIRSRCGFCDACFEDWDMRVLHLTAHFKEGVRMEEWVGDWGFEDEVLRLLQNAVRPGVDNLDNLMA